MTHARTPRRRAVLAALVLVAVLAGCSGSGGSEPAARPAPSTAATTTTSSTAPATDPDPAPELVTTGDDLTVVLRSMLDYEFWALRHPAEALANLDTWVYPGGSYHERLTDAYTEQAEKQLVATGQPEIVVVREEPTAVSDGLATAMLRSDGYQLVGPTETLESPPFEPTLFVYDFTKAGTGTWRVIARSIPEPG